MNIEIKTAITPDQIQSCFEVMRQLHPHLTDKLAFVEADTLKFPSY